MNGILKTLFEDNPYLAEQAWAFCESLPEFRAAEQEYRREEERISARLGYESFAAFEQAQSWYMAQLTKAYYLFGLGLRQEVLSTLQPKIS